MQRVLLLPVILAATAVSPACAGDVSINRDQWGVPHIHGTTHADAFFGMGYAQAEDYFWQLEDTCIRSLGRYAEVVGEEGVSSDILNRSFEIVRRSREDFEALNPEYRKMAAAFSDGINHFLETHPNEQPRLINRFEPWHAIAMDRHMILHFTYRRAHVGKPNSRSGDSIASFNGGWGMVVLAGAGSRGIRLSTGNPRSHWIQCMGSFRQPYEIRQRHAVC